MQSSEDSHFLLKPYSFMRRWVALPYVQKEEEEEEVEKKQYEKNGNIASIKELNSIFKKQQEGEGDLHLLYAAFLFGAL